MQTRQALEYLSQNTLLHIDMLESIRRGQAELLAASPEGVLLRDRLGDSHMLSARDEEAAAQMLAPISRVRIMVTHQDFAVPMAEERYRLERELACRNVAYLSTKPPAPVSCPAHFAVMDEQYLDFVHRHYSHGADVPYVRDRLQSDAILGAFIQDTPVGFIGMHAEGSIGMLEVLPDYRRMGIAQALEIQMIRRTLERGHIPFAQITLGNQASMNLQLKLGYAAAQETICWVCGRD